MTFLRVLAPVWAEECDKVCMRAAVALSQPAEAQVLALMAEIDPLTSLAWTSGAQGFVTSTLMDALEENARVRAKRAEAAVQDVRNETKASGAGDIVFRRSRGLSAASVVAEACALADIAVFADDKDFRADRRQAFEAALIEARTPVLLARSADPGDGPIALCWDGGAHAGRALRAAMPLIRAKKQVTILFAPEGLSERRRRAASPEDLVHLLARQGIAGDVRVVADKVADGSRLLAAAQHVGAKLLVCGAFGHTRAQEFLFGGATQSFLDAAGGPSVLMAH